MENMKSDDVYIYDEAKRRRVKIGTIRGHVYFKVVKPGHFFRLYQAYAIQKHTLFDLKRKGVKTIQIITAREVYESNLEAWLSDNAIIKEFGHGDQVFLPIKFMTLIPKTTTEAEDAEIYGDDKGGVHQV